MSFHKLRIAWSVAWGIFAVLLCVLWVRSYSWWDAITLPRAGNYGLVIKSFRGVPVVRVLDLSQGVAWSAGVESRPETDPFVRSWEKTGRSASSWAYSMRPRDQYIVTLRYLYLSAIATAIGTVPWINRFKSFSLRTLLVATTLFAVMLGLIVWLR